MKPTLVAKSPAKSTQSTTLVQKVANNLGTFAKGMLVYAFTNLQGAAGLSPTPSPIPCANDSETTCQSYLACRNPNDARCIGGLAVVVIIFAAMLWASIASFRKLRDMNVRCCRSNEYRPQEQELKSLTKKHSIYRDLVLKDLWPIVPEQHLDSRLLRIDEFDGAKAKPPVVPDVVIEQLSNEPTVTKHSYDKAAPKLETIPEEQTDTPAAYLQRAPRNYGTLRIAQLAQDLSASIRSNPHTDPEQVELLEMNDTDVLRWLEEHEPAKAISVRAYQPKPKRSSYIPIDRAS